MVGPYGAFGGYATPEQLAAEQQALAMQELERTPEGSGAHEFSRTARAAQNAQAALYQAQAKRTGELGSKTQEKSQRMWKLAGGVAAVSVVALGAYLYFGRR